MFENDCAIFNFCTSSLGSYLVVATLRFGLGVIALTTESLERRFDTAFGVTRTEQERNETLQERIRQIETELSRLGEAFAMDDQIRSERDYFERLLLQHGIDPWALPNTEEHD